MTPDTPTVDHTTHANNIHEFTFYSAGAEGIRVWITMLEALYQTGENTIYTLIDTRQSGMLPIRPLISHIRDLMKRYPQRPRFCVAVVTKTDNMTVMLLDSLIRTLTRDDAVRYVSEYDYAMNWLVEQQTTDHK